MKIQKAYIPYVLVIFIGVVAMVSLSLWKTPGARVALQGENPQQGDIVNEGVGEDIEAQQEEVEAPEEVNEKLDTYPLGNGKTIEESNGTSVEKKQPEDALDTGVQPSEEKAITTNKYVVRENDTLFTIAQRANVTTEQLKKLNQLKHDVILVGQVLFINASENLIADNSNSNKETTSRGYREEDLYWLSRIIHAEAQGESYEGKVAVGNVVLNRVESSLFPNTIKEVVFDKQHGYTQFSPVLDGNIYNTPNSDSINAAKDALSGKRPVGEALYFLNMSKSTNFWIVQNRKYFMTIGDHDFYY